MKDDGDSGGILDDDGDGGGVLKDDGDNGGLAFDCVGITAARGGD